MKSSLAIAMAMLGGAAAQNSSFLPPKNCQTLGSTTQCKTLEPNGNAYCGEWFVRWCLRP
jgi:hypothetical protein